MLKPDHKLNFIEKRHFNLGDKNERFTIEIFQAEGRELYCVRYWRDKINSIEYRSIAQIVTDDTESNQPQTKLFSGLSLDEIFEESIEWIEINILDKN
ncbi:hypothetical protein [Marinigracilibium pacificum]|uniref:Uncharacterized protein n=1 Tax=Marinigracilibium pacificum TaxID=2729599 RepID=A0A848J4B7_9BACT|nr:hypothetical protein [Marinigracilibium pacificum]NMM50345.1 hypothetical protein [Marinigracilibium pacificum]